MHEFEIVIDDDAKAMLRDELARVGVERSFVILERVGPVGDVTRGPDGNVKWSISHPHPWRVSFGGVYVGQVRAEEMPDSKFLFVDEIPVLLPIMAQSHEVGLHISVRSGNLFVEAITGL